jgi:hypothetical protein
MVLSVIKKLIHWQDDGILAKRAIVYELAKAKRPERWSGNSRNWEQMKTVTLNPQKSDHNRESSKIAA